MRKWLKDFRIRAGLTQAEVAEKAHIGRSTYGNIESGMRDATVTNAKKIAKVLGFHWTLFFEDESHEVKNEKQVC